MSPSASAYDERTKRLTVMGISPVHKAGGNQLRARGQEGHGESACIDIDRRGPPTEQNQGDLDVEELDFG